MLCFTRAYVAPRPHILVSSSERCQSGMRTKQVSEPKLLPLTHACRELYERFYDGFASHGEPNIPFDKTFLQDNAFYGLLARLKQHVEEHQRDHWCAPCGRSGRLCVPHCAAFQDSRMQRSSCMSWSGSVTEYAWKKQRACNIILATFHYPCGAAGCSAACAASGASSPTSCCSRSRKTPHGPANS